MKRKTSAAVYKAVEKSGLLSERRWQVYKTLHKIGPATAAEISNADQSSFTNPAKGDNSHARISELIRQGLVEEVGTRVCKVTGREVLIFDITGGLPSKLERRPKNPLKCFVESLLLKLKQLNHLPIHGSEKSKRLALIVAAAESDLRQFNSRSKKKSESQS